MIYVVEVQQDEEPIVHSFVHIEAIKSWMRNKGVCSEEICIFRGELLKDFGKRNLGIHEPQDRR